MTTPAASFPLVAELLEQRFGTLYVLSDSPVRLRDSISVVELVRFFANQHVTLDVRPIMARYRRYLSARDVKKAFAGNETLAAELQRRRQSDGSPDHLIEWLFKHAEEHELRQATGASPIDEQLAPRGPMIILGRPRLYPPRLIAQLTRELAAEAREMLGRFVMPDHDMRPGEVRPAERAVDPESPEFWSVRDRYYNFGYNVAGVQAREDYGIVRKVRGAFARRTITLAYGTSSLGTIGATRMLIDEDQNERLVKLDVGGHFERHGEVELLVHVARDGASAAACGAPSGPSASDLTPRELSIIVGPSAPVSRAAARWIVALTSDADDPLFDGLYERRSNDGQVVRLAALVDSSPADPTAFSVRLVGGRELETCARMVRELAGGATPTPLLLVGPSGVGKELLARLAYEQRVLALLHQLRLRAQRPVPVVVGAHFKAMNCAGMTDTLAESRLFGIKEGVGTGVTADPGFLLSAGEGAVLHDEAHLMNETQQARLLRVLQPPHLVTPLGFHTGIPVHALIAAAMSRSPEELLKENRMLPELFARFRSGVVHIPALAERPGDIPALLTAFAGRTIRMDENVLRCVLADRHELNVRSLIAIVERAQGVQGRRGQTAAGASLEITLDALGAARDLVAQLKGSAPATRTFEFEPHFKPLLSAHEFDEAARVLTSLEPTEAGQLRLRQRQAEYGRTLATDGFHFANVNEAGAAWVRIIHSITERVSDKEDRRVCLGKLGVLCQRRFDGSEVRAFAMLLRRARQTLGLTPTSRGAREQDKVHDEDIALSLGVDPARVSVWSKEDQGRPAGPSGT
jgi:DNA-binding NtrC family response regulator